MLNKPRVSIQGGAGSFHHIAAGQIFSDFSMLERPSFRDIFEDVSIGKADFGLLAIENSIAGSLTYNYDLLGEFNSTIVGETYLRISHQLIALPGVTLEGLKEVWSHPMAIQQSRSFLRTLPVRIIEHEDTAGAVVSIKEDHRRDVAAIASSVAAEIHGMEILKRNIETDPNNYTRFLLISNQEGEIAIEGNEYKTSLHFGFTDRAGALVEILTIFADAKINMSKIESRPRLGSPWRYDFYIDLEIDGNSDAAKSVLNLLAQKTEFLRILGTYPKLKGHFNNI
ncbi:MAG: prephenate dehydratase domain-containing protein [Balneolales bacterium]